MRSAVFLFTALLALAQTPTPAPLISVYYSLDNAKTYAYRWLAIDPPLTITVDSTGRPHLGISNVLTVTSEGAPIGTTSSVDLRAGAGVLFALTNTPQAILIQPSVDTSVIAHRVDPPKASGPAVDPISGQPLGTGAWAADAGFFYFVVPNSDSTGFVWARVPLTTSW